MSRLVGLVAAAWLFAFAWPACAPARDTVAQNAVKNTFLPFHPGAVRYYREVGLNIPDALVPTD